METYGMALAEARTLGLPILAHAGGNVGAHVTSGAGGELVASHEELAAAFLSLCRDPHEHHARLRLARAHALPARAWSQAAAEFTALAAGLTTPAAR
jgi:glycosyltransferase involved in cell wall biosynthesis